MKGKIGEKVKNLVEIIKRLFSMNLNSKKNSQKDNQQQKAENNNKQKEQNPQNGNRQQNGESNPQNSGGGELDSKQQGGKEEREQNPQQGNNQQGKEEQREPQKGQEEQSQQNGEQGQQNCESGQNNNQGAESGTQNGESSLQNGKQRQNDVLQQRGDRIQQQGGNLGGKPKENSGNLGGEIEQRRKEEENNSNLIADNGQQGGTQRGKDRLNANPNAGNGKSQGEEQESNQGVDDSVQGELNQKINLSKQDSESVEGKEVSATVGQDVEQCGVQVNQTSGSNQSGGEMKRTSLDAINGCVLNLNGGSVPYGNLEQDAEKVNELIVRNVINNFFKMRFRATNSNLNTRAGASEKVRGVTKWDALQVTKHRATKEYNKILQDKYDYEYSSGKNEKIPLAIYIDMSPSMNRFIGVLTTIALQLIKHDVRIIVGQNQSVQVQINSVPNNITQREFVDILRGDLSGGKAKAERLQSQDLHKYLTAKNAEKVIIFSDYDPASSVAKLSQTKCQVYWLNVCGVREDSLSCFGYRGAICSAQTEREMLEAIIRFTKQSYQSLRYNAERQK